VNTMKKSTLHVASIAALAALLTAACATPSFARSHNPNNTATETTMSVTPNGDMQTTTTVASSGIDYRILGDPDFNYFQIRRAQAYGLSDWQIAQAAKLAHYAWVPMEEVVRQIENGSTMANLCIWYGVSMDDVMNASAWNDRLHNYMDAYRHTGEGALRNGPPMENVATYSSTTSLGGTTVTTPNGTTITTPSNAIITPDSGMLNTPGGTTVTTPSGTTVTTPDSSGGATITTPNGTTTTTPNGTTVTTPDGTTVTTPPSQ